MAKDNPNKGWTKELAKSPKAPESKKAFSYNKPINKVDNPNSMAVGSRQRAYRSVPQDKTTSFKAEQTIAKASHNKGSK